MNRTRSIGSVQGDGSRGVSIRRSPDVRKGVMMNKDQHAPHSRYRAYADAALAALQAWYDPTTALYSGVSWWHSAICLDVVIDYTTRTRNTRYAYIIPAIFEAHKDSKFLQNPY